MNMENISEGMVLTYPELCKKLEIEKKQGDSKTAQLREISSYCSYQKRGRYFYIEEIYSEPIDLERKLREDAIYPKFIEQVLLYYLIGENGYTAICTSTEWWVRLGLVARKYHTCKNKEYEQKKLTSLSPEMQTEDIASFYNITSTRFSGIFNRALKTLRDRRYIEYFPSYIIVERDGKKREAHDWEIKNILENERLILNRNHIKDRRHLMMEPYETQKRIYDAFNQEHYDLYGWKMAYPAIKIVYVRKEMLKTALEMANEDMYYIQKKQMNKISREAVNITLNHKYHQNVTQEEVDEYMDKLDEKYKLQQMLADELIDIL